MASQIRVRPAAVAGLFYPDDPVALRSTVASLLAARSRGAAGAPTRRPPKAVIAPHAGYSYSGPIAASAFAALASHAAGAAGATGAAGAAGAAGDASAPEVRRVVLLGPSHQVPLRGLGLPGAERFATPLGMVPVDLEAAAAVDRLPQVAVRPDAHAAEHSLEVELPFLQVVLGPFELLPLVVGQAGAEEVAEVLELVWGGDDTVLVISSDLSHYLPAETAERVDRETAAQILALAGPLTSRQACGAVPINGLLAAARRQGLVPRQLDLRHSGDTSGDRTRVVGYGAWAFDAHAA
ncbi:MAG TPA: AmmeMemoRadiSam system protein B [Thermoanaerobaculia bacterium]|nr:AmmeMemoRadiSam system protein B [Thermoanaerobaculia bacterium]